MPRDTLDILTDLYIVNIDGYGSETGQFDDWGDALDYIKCDLQGINPAPGFTIVTANRDCGPIGGTWITSTEDAAKELAAWFIENDMPLPDALEAFEHLAHDAAQAASDWDRHVRTESAASNFI